jgi:hypothetical protein
VAAPAPAAWNFHPPAPGYSAAAPYYPTTATAPYPQAMPYPQPAPWLAPQAVPQAPPPANFVGGVLAEADAAKAAAHVAAPVIAKTLPPATRRRESTWRNPWMVAAGGTLLTIIAVLVMLRAGDFAREPDFVDADLPTLTVPAIDAFGEGKQVPPSKPKQAKKNADDQASPLEPAPMAIVAAAPDTEPAPKPAPELQPLPMPVPAAAAPSSGGNSNDPAAPKGRFTPEESARVAREIGLQIQDRGPDEFLIFLDDKFRDEHAEHLLNYPRATGLIFTRSPITKATAAVAAKMPQLREFNLQNCESFNDDDMQPLAAATKLEYFRSISGSVKGQGLEHLVPCKQLKRIDIHPNPTHAGYWQTVAKLTSLEEFPLPEREFGDAELAQMANLKNLKKLRLTNSSVTGAGWATFANFPKLKELSLGRGDAADYRHIANLTEMETISCGNAQGPGDVILEHLKNLTKLKELHAPSSITDAAFPRIAAFANLERLTLHNGRGLTNAAFEPLSKCSKLQELSVIFDLECEPWTELSRIPSLTKLTLPGDVSPAGIDLLMKLPRLTSLQLRVADERGFVAISKAPALTNLRISANAVTRDGLSQLAKIKTLENLHVHSLSPSRELSLDEVSSLKELKRLQHLHLGRLTLHPAAQQFLKQELPRCFVNSHQ